MTTQEILQRHLQNSLSRFTDMQIRSLEIMDGVTFVEFYATIYNIAYPIYMDTDEIKEMVLPGAFDLWLSTPECFDKVVHLLDHDDVCGIVDKIYSDNKGLIIRSALLSGQNNEEGDIALSHYNTAAKIGKTVKHSIGFMPFDRNNKSDYYFDPNLDCFILKRGKLFDVSTVTKWAANTAAIDLQRTLQDSTTEKEPEKETNWNFLNKININL